MWQHIDVQADWRRSWTYRRAPNARHFVGFVNVPVQAPFLYGYSETPPPPPIKSPFTTPWGYGGNILDVNPRVLTGVQKLRNEEVRSGSKRHRHFAGFFNVPILHRHGTNLFIRWFRHNAPLVAFYDTLGIRRTFSRLKPPAPSRGKIELKMKHWKYRYKVCYWRTVGPILSV